MRKQKRSKTYRAVLLLSGGFDSPVAGKLLQKKDPSLEMVGLHFSQEPFTDNTAELKVIILAKHLGIKKVIVVTVGNQLATLTKQCNHRLYYVLQRRLMWRIAEKIASRESASYLVTGENLGQVSSQTLPNLAINDKAVVIPILRPVLTMNKQEILNLAQEFGTYETSKGPEFCSVLGPKYPVTRATLLAVETEEKKVDVAQMIAEALETVRVVDVC